MRYFLLAITALFTAVGSGISQEATSVTEQRLRQYGDIPPPLKCHYPRKERSFCKSFPNFSLRHGICNPEPTMLGHIEWCREDVTITEQDECGKYMTYDAVVITYRPVYSNGAWGKKFKRTIPKEPTLIEPPILAKGVVK